MPKSALKKVDWNHIAFKGDYTEERKQQIIAQFTDGMIKTEKLTSTDCDMRFSFRLNKEARVICTNAKFNGKDCLVILSIAENHEYDKTYGMKAGAADGVDEILLGDFIPTDNNTRDIHSVLGMESPDGKIVVYSREQTNAMGSIAANLQEAAVSNVKYFIINGLAGSGKTTVAYDVLSAAQEQGAEAIYITKSEGLVAQAKEALNTNSEGASAQVPIKCLTSEQLLSEHLFKYFEQFVDAPLRAKDTTLKNALKTFGSTEALKARMMKMHVEHIQDQNPEINECLAAYLKETLSRKEDFVKWLKKTTNQDTQKLVKLLLETMSLDELYFEVQKPGIELGKKTTMHPDLHNADANGNSIASTISKKYIDYLSSNKKIDPAFIRKREDSALSSSSTAKDPFVDYTDEIDRAECDDDAALRKVVVIDEAQNFSPTEIKAILDEIGPNAIVYLCRDGNQSLSDPFDLTTKTMYEFTKKDPEHVYNLNNSYRTPPAITKLVNILLNIKAQVVGGKLHAIDSGASASAASAEDSSDIFTSSADNAGYIKWITESSDPAIGELKAISKNIIASVVIVFNDADKIAAIKMFPDSMILTPREVVGLEYQNVILYNPFGHISRDDETLFKEKYNASTAAPVNFPKDTTKIKYAPVFNELFVAMTRATSNLYVVACKADKSKSGEFFKQAFTGILEQYSTGAAEATKELSLDALVKYVDINKSTWSVEVLKRYITETMKRIVGDKSSDASKRQLLSALADVVQSSSIKDSVLDKEIKAKLTLLKPAPAAAAAASKGVSSSDSSSGDDTTGASFRGGKHQKASVAAPAAAAASEVSSEFTIGKVKIASMKDGMKITNTPSIDEIKAAARESLLSAEENKKDIVKFLLDAAREQQAKAERAIERAKLEKALLACDNEDESPADMAVDQKILGRLMTAVRRGNVTEVKKIISAHPNYVNAKQENGVTPLHVAAEHCKDSEIFQLLIKKGAYLNATMLIDGATAGLTPLHFALIKNNLVALDALLAASVDLNDTMSTDGSTPLHIAAEYCKDSEIFQLLLDRGESVNAIRARDGVTPLHIAATNNNSVALKTFLAAGGDIHMSSPSLGMPFSVLQVLQSSNYDHLDISHLVTQISEIESQFARNPESIQQILNEIEDQSIKSIIEARLALASGTAPTDTQEAVPAAAAAAASYVGSDDTTSGNPAADYPESDGILPAGMVTDIE